MGGAVSCQRQPGSGILCLNSEPLGDRDAQDSERSPHATCVAREHAVEAWPETRGWPTTQIEPENDLQRRPPIRIKAAIGKSHTYRTTL